MPNSVPDADAVELMRSEGFLHGARRVLQSVGESAHSLFGSGSTLANKVQDASNAVADLQNLKGRGLLDAKPSLGNLLRDKKSLENYLVKRLGF